MLTHSPPVPRPYPRPHQCSSIRFLANTAEYEEGRSWSHSFSWVGAKVWKEEVDGERPLGLGT